MKIKLSQLSFLRLSNNLSVPLPRGTIIEMSEGLGDLLVQHEFAENYELSEKKKASLTTELPRAKRKK